MTRHEEIEQAETNYAHRHDDDFVYGESEAFAAGARWADAHPDWEAIVKRLQEEITNDLRQDRWMSVEDELPKCEKTCEFDKYLINMKESVPCLVLTKYGKMFVATFNQDYDEEGMPIGKPYWFDEHPEAANDGCWLDEEVTHWMPLPKAPRKGE